jgi:NDP-sugar pyrophosphorylase family protein
MNNILIPMGGKGKRFRDAGYQITKPLIDVNGKPMIQRVIENLNLDWKFIFLVSDCDEKEYKISEKLASYCNASEVIIEDSTKRLGAAGACLLAEDLINNDDELLTANSDQLMEWDSNNFIDKMHSLNADGGIVTFTELEKNPKWSFAKVLDNKVVEVAEKKVISDRATVGVYYFKRGSEFVSGLKQMISKNIRINNEFYVCPVFNELISIGKNIHEYPIETFHGIGVPEDLEKYLKR